MEEARRMESHPVIICGGSLAGASLAIRLKQLGITPLVLEKSCFPRTKLCGEFLGPDSLESLRQLGVWDQVHAQGRFPISKAWFYTQKGQAFPIEMEWINPKAPYGIAVTRHSLDWILLQEAKAQGVPVLDRCYVHPAIERSERGFSLHVTHLDAAGFREVYHTSILLDATGALGGLMRQSVTESKSQVLQQRKIGFKIHLELKNPPPDEVLRMFLHPGGYGGLLSLGGNVHNVCLIAPFDSAPLIKHSVLDFLNDTLGSNPVAKEYLADAQPVGTPKTTAGLHFGTDFCQENSLIRVGDALSLVDPFTGSGMALALETGILAGDIVAKGMTRNLTYPEMVNAYTTACQSVLGNRLRVMKLFRSYLQSSTIQDVTAPLLKPLLPFIAKILR